MSKVYIAGAITDNPNYEEQFKAAEERLKERGYEVFNPAKNQGYTYREYINMGLFELMHCDAIYLLKGYENSTGATLEHDYARTVGLKIMLEEDELQTGDKPAGSSPKNVYLLGEKSELIFSTGYVPEPMNYYEDTLLMSIKDNCIVMDVVLEKHYKKRIYMSVKQAEAMIKALKKQINYLEEDEVSDLISKSKLIEFIQEEIKQDRPDDFKIRNIQKFIYDMPTVDNVDDRHIPKKPLERRFGVMVCPDCEMPVGRRVAPDIYEEKHYFCSRCGKAVYWEV